MKNSSIKYLIYILFAIGFVAQISQPKAETRDGIVGAAHQAFDGMPSISIVGTIAGQCGADDLVNADVAYCTTRNTIFVSSEASRTDRVQYQVAHVLGHAIQVQHGIADFALAQIRARRDEEPYLRGLVARQVECLAGFLYQRAGLPRASLNNWFDAEPFTGSHWGRDPLRVGPKVSIGLAARDEWFVNGQAATSPAACAVGELPAGPLVAAFKG